MRKGYALAPVFAVLVAYLAAFALHARTGPGPDPDRWFHFAVSRAMSQEGFARALPQAEDLGWGHGFVEPYFLFHAVTAIGYRLGGDAGVIAVCVLLALGTLLLMYRLGRRWAPPWLAAALAAGLPLSSLYLTPRLLQVRPHLLAMLTALALVTGLLEGRALVIFAGAAGYALGYHALYVPLFLILLGLAFARRTERGTMALAGLGGLAAGVLANPYFPLNLEGAFQQLCIALAAGETQPGMAAGRELARLPVGVFLEAFGPGLACFACAVFGLCRTARPARAPLAFLVTAAGAFWALCLLSARASEYALPFSALAAAAAWPALAPLLRKKGARAKAAALACAAAAPSAPFLWGLAFGSGPGLPAALTRAALEALDRVPAAEAGRKVVNCMWTLGPFVYYKRPDLRFVDALHPLLLKFSSPEKYEALRRVKLGFETDAYGRLARTFGARYVLCDLPALNDGLAADPRLELLYHDDAANMSLFRLGEPAPKELVSHFEAALLARPERVDDPAVIDRFPKRGEEVSGAAVDFLALYGGGDGRETRCAWIRPAEAELARHAGARTVAVGGGAHIRLWLNRRLLYASDPFLPDARMVQKTIALPRPLRTDDRLEAAVCHRQAQFWSFALWLR